MSMKPADRDMVAHWTVTSRSIPRTSLAYRETVWPFWRPIGHMVAGAWWGVGAWSGSGSVDVLRISEKIVPAHMGSVENPGPITIMWHASVLLVTQIHRQIRN